MRGTAQEARRSTARDQRGEPVTRPWLVFSLFFIALTLLASTLWTRGLWAMSSWAAVSPFVSFVAAILIASQLFVRRATDPLRRIPTIRSAPLRLLVAAAFAVALLSLLRSRTALWGDRAALRTALESGAYVPSAPLSTFVQWALYRLMNGIFLWSADSIQTCVSILAGLVFVLVSTRAAGLLSNEPEGVAERRLACAFLLSSGFVTVFFGFGGNIPTATLLVAAFIVTELEYLRGARSPVAPAVLLAAAVLSHVSSAYCIPAFLFSLVLAPLAREARRKALIVAGAFIAGWVLFEIAAPGLWKAPGPARCLFEAFVESARTAHVGGWRGLGNRAWLAVNSLLIMGPASIVAVSLLVAGRRAGTGREEAQGPDRRKAAPAEERFLSICVVSALVMLFAGSPLLDEGLRWSVFLTAGPAFSMYALWALRRRLSEPDRFARTTWLLILLGLFHTLPLVIVDASPRLAEKRILQLPLGPGRAERIIGDAALRKGRLDEAHSWYVASLEKDPSNDVTNARTARIEMKQEEYSAAISHFLSAHERRPEDPHYRFELAEALTARRWFPEAIAQLETLTTAYPESVAFWRRLGFARNNGGKYEPAVAAYEEALALEPKNEENVRNLVSALLNRAAELQQQKKLDEAQRLYERAIGLFPRDWRAYNNLAIIEMDHGRYEKAYQILSETLKLHPYESDLHFNLGIALEKLGRPKEALAHMLTAQELNPVYSAAPTHIQRLEKKLGIWNKARADSQRARLGTPPAGERTPH